MESIGAFLAILEDIPVKISRGSMSPNPSRRQVKTAAITEYDLLHTLDQQYTNSVKKTDHCNSGVRSIIHIGPTQTVIRKQTTARTDQTMRKRHSFKIALRSAKPDMISAKTRDRQLFWAYWPSSVCPVA